MPTRSASNSSGAERSDMIDFTVSQDSLAGLLLGDGFQIRFSRNVVVILFNVVVTLF
jgi:hypothetical protein